MNDSRAQPGQPAVGTQVRNLIWNEMGLLTLLLLEILILLPWYRAHVLPANQNLILMAYLIPIGYSLLVMYISRFSLANQALSGFYRLIQLGVLIVGVIGFSKWVLYPYLPLSIFQIISRLASSFAKGTGGIPVSILLILSVIYMWWRGIAISSSVNLDFFNMRRSFRVGLLLLGLFGVFHRAVESTYLIEILPFFFASGLVSVTLGRTYRLSQRTAAFKLPFTGRWFVGMGVILAITLVLGFIGASLMQTEVAQQIAEFIGAIFLQGFQTFVIIISPLFVWIIPVAEKLMEMLMNQAPVEPTPSDSDGSFFGDQQSGTVENLQIHSDLIVAIVVLVFVLIVFLIVRNARRRMRSGLPDFGDEGESTFDPSSIQRGIRRILEQAQESLDSLRRYGVSRRMLAATAIRRIYVQFLNLAEDLGRPRKTWETPFEFQHHISKMFPEEGEHIEIITRAYTQVRYGEFPEEEEIVSKVRGAWNRIKRSIR